MKTCSNIVRRLMALALVAAVVGHTRPAAATSTGNSVTVWNRYAVDLIVGKVKKPGAAATIDLTLVHTAIYDAVNAIDGVRFKPYASAPAVTPGASIDAAVAQAYGGKREIVWYEVFAGEKAYEGFGEWLPTATAEAVREFKSPSRGRSRLRWAAASAA